MFSISNFLFLIDLNFLIFMSILKTYILGVPIISNHEYFGDLLILFLYHNGTNLSKFSLEKLLIQGSHNTHLSWSLKWSFNKNIYGKFTKKI